MAADLDAPECLQAAFELGTSSPGGSRLLHLCTTHIMRHLGAQLDSPAFQQLQRSFRRELETHMEAELRDRLATVCALNGGVGLELANVVAYS